MRDVREAEGGPKDVFLMRGEVGEYLGEAEFEDEFCGERGEGGWAMGGGGAVGQGVPDGRDWLGEDVVLQRLGMVGPWEV